MVNIFLNELMESECSLRMMFNVLIPLTDSLLTADGPYKSFVRDKGWSITNMGSFKFVFDHKAIAM